MKIAANSSNIKEQLLHIARSLHKYAVPIFLLFLISIYGFLAWRVIQLSQTEPDQAKVSAELKTAGVPKIDPEVVKKMQELEDNSVSAQSLFEEARRNPFKE